MFSKYERTDYIQSIYHYPETEVLINKFDIRDEKVLTQLESDLTQNRLFELYESPVIGHLGVRHFNRIHHYIFQDLYSFAGKYRSEDIWKGDTFFCKSDVIGIQLEKILLELKEENFLIGLSDKMYIFRMAYYMSELNIIHPYREGNGRAIREYIRLVALKNNRIINWQNVDGKRMLEAAIRAVDFDYRLLETCIANCLV